jgi:hypothetical protein
VPPTVRLLAAAACLAAWLVLLFLGFAFGGFVHLLALAGLVLAFGVRRGARSSAEVP